MMLAKVLSPTESINHPYTMNTIGDTCQQIRETCARRTLIVCDKAMLRLGYTHDVIRGLHDHRIHYELFSDVVSNPSTELEENLLDACITFAKKNRVDSIVGIGGDEVTSFVKKLSETDLAYVPVFTIRMS